MLLIPLRGRSGLVCVRAHNETAPWGWEARGCMKAGVWWLVQGGEMRPWWFNRA